MISNTKYFKIFNFACVKFQKNFKFTSSNFTDSLITLNFVLIKVNANITSILYTLNPILHAIIQNIKAKVLLVAHVHFVRYCCHLSLLDIDLASGVICASASRRATNQNPCVSADNNALKMNIIVIFARQED